MYDKTCHLLVELEHKALQALKKHSLECYHATTLRLSKVNELDVFWICAYECSALYKEGIKLYYDKKFEKRVLELGDLVLLQNSRLYLFLNKLKSRHFG